MNAVDLIVGIIIVLSALWGYKKGLLRMIGGIAVGIVALFLSVILRDSFASVLYELHPGLFYGIYVIISFILIFVGVLTIGMIIVKFVYKVISLTPLGIIDKVIGSTIALVFALTLVFSIFYITYQSGWESQVLKESFSFKMFMELSPDNLLKKNDKISKEKLDKDIKKQIEKKIKDKI